MTTINLTPTDFTYPSTIVDNGTELVLPRVTTVTAPEWHMASLSETLTVDRSIVAGGFITLEGGPDAPTHIAFTNSNGKTFKYLSMPEFAIGSRGRIFGDALGALQNKMTIRCIINTKYTGNPSTQGYFFSLGTTTNGLGYGFALAHQTSGFLHIRMYGPTSTLQDFITLGWSPIQGQDYEFEVSLDFTNGVVALYIDGVLKNRAANAGLIQNRSTGSMSFNLGSNYTDTYLCGHIYIREIAIYNDIVHDPLAINIGDQAYKSPIPIEQYSKTEAVATATSPVILSTVIDFFSSEETLPANTLVTYIANVNGTDLYFDALSKDWLPSDGTISQSNTSSEVSIGINYLDISEIGILIVNVLLQSVDGVSSPKFKSLSFSEYAPGLGNCPVVIVNGYILQDNCKPMTSADITFSSKPYYLNSNLITINQKVTIDATGYFQVILPITVDLVTDKSIEEAACKILIEQTDEEGVTSVRKDSIVIPYKAVVKLGDIVV